VLQDVDRCLRGGILLTAGAAMAQEKQLRIGYQPNPIQDASIAMMEKWGAKHGVKIIKTPNSYAFTSRR